MGQSGASVSVVAIAAAGVEQMCRSVTAVVGKSLHSLLDGLTVASRRPLLPPCLTTAREERAGNRKRVA